MSPTPRQRRRAFRGWCATRALTEAQGEALLVGLARAGVYLRVDEHGAAHLRLMGGDMGQATIRGLMVLHRLGRAMRSEER